MNKISTCPVCFTKVPHISDGKMRLCDCEKMGVDCTKEYTRFIGYISMEDPSYENWYAQFEMTIKLLRKNYLQYKTKQ